MIKVEATVLDVVQGEIKHIIVEDSVYETIFIGLVGEVQYGDVEEAEEIPEINVVTPEEQKAASQNQTIKVIDDVPIIEDVVFDIRNMKERSEIVSVILKHFPNLPKSLLSRYIHVYLKYGSFPRERTDLGNLIDRDGSMSYYEIPYNRIKNGETAEKVMRECYPLVQFRTILNYARKYQSKIKKNKSTVSTSETKPVKKSYTRKKRHSSRYHRNISDKDYQQVDVALRKFGVLNTTKDIVKETGLHINKVRAILDYMRTEEGIIEKRKRGNNVYTYHFL